MKLKETSFVAKSVKHKPTSHLKPETKTRRPGLPWHFGLLGLGPNAEFDPCPSREDRALARHPLLCIGESRPFTREHLNSRATRAAI